MIGKIFLFSIIQLMSLTLCMANQEIMLNVNVSDTTLNLNETLQYEIQLKGLDTNTKPILTPPKLEKFFSVISSNESTYFSIINGKTSYTKSYIYTLKPYQTGKIMIPSAKMTYKGKSYTSQKTEITVTAQQNNTSTSSSNSKTSNLSESVTKAAQSYNIFAQAIANKDQAYVGEQITYQVKFFRRIRIYSDINYTNPSLDNFWTEDLTLDNQDKTTNIQGKTFYERDIIHKALFGLSAGNHIIDGPLISFILNPFGGTQTLQVNPLKLTILDLPSENKPVNFSGLVGNFTINMENTQNTIKNNTPLTLYITIKGQGNIKNISELNFKKNPKLKIYKSSIKNDIMSESTISGSRTFEYIVVPQETGSITLPAFSLNYFSPEKKAYQTIQTPEQVLTVIANPDSLTSEKKPPIVSKPLKKYQSLNYLKTINESKSIHYFWESSLQKTLLTLNILSILIFIFIKSKKMITEKLSLKTGQKYQLKQLLKTLNMYSKKQNISLANIHNSYLDYLSLLLGNQAKGDSKQRIIDALQKTSLSEKNIDSLLLLWDDLNIANYTAENISETDKQAFVQRIIKVIQQNQKEL